VTLVREACRENGAALLLVSHDRETLSQFEKVREFEHLNQVSQEEANL
jgi:putative ABC transport system ATP-binding protein